MLRGKVGLMLLGVMCAVTMGASPVKASAEINTTAIVESVRTLENGTYEVKNNTRYVTEGNKLGESMARKVVSDTTKVEVKDGKTFLTLEFASDLYKYMDNVGVQVNGEAIKVVEDSTNRTITFEVPSVDTEVLVNMHVALMGRDVQFYLSNDVSTLA